jgi:deferrochelatase/peroxidase EfeB
MVAREHDEQQLNIKQRIIEEFWKKRFNIVVLGVGDTTWSEVLLGAWNQPANFQSIPQMPHQQSHGACL